MQDSLTITSQSRDEERDQRFWKVALLGIVGLGANLLAVQAFVTYLATATSNLLYVVAAAGLATVVVFVLQAFFVKSATLLRTVVFVQTAGPLLLFLDHLGDESVAVLLIAVLLFFVLAEIGSVRGLRQAAASMRVRFFDTARTVIPKALTGALLFAAALIYLTYFSWGTLNATIGRKFVDQVLTSADPVLRLYFSRVSVDQNVEDFLREVVRAQLEGGSANLLGKFAPGSNEALQTFLSLPVPQRDVIIDRVTESFRGSLEPVVGSLNPNEPVRDAVYRIVADRLAGLTPSQYKTFSVGGVVLVFFALKGFLSLFQWAFALVAYLVFKLLMALGFARTGVATQSREFVLLP